MWWQSRVQPAIPKVIFEVVELRLLLDISNIILVKFRPTMEAAAEIVKTVLPYKAYEFLFVLEKFGFVFRSVLLATSSRKQKFI